MDIQGVPPGSAVLPPGSVVVTPKDMYDEIKAMHVSLNDLISKHENVPTKLADHEARIRVLEHGWWRMLGAASVLSVGVSVGVTFIK